MIATFLLGFGSVDWAGIAHLSSAKSTGTQPWNCSAGEKYFKPRPSDVYSGVRHGESSETQCKVLAETHHNEIFFLQNVISRVLVVSLSSHDERLGNAAGDQWEF